MKKSILDVVHGSAKSLYEAGVIDVTTMHEFDTLCLPPIKSSVQWSLNYLTS